MVYYLSSKKYMEMSILEEKKKIHIGMRNMKTAIAVTVCAFLYFLVDRNPAFACIGVIFGMGSDMDDSILNGGNRFFGTLIGGFIGMALYRLYIIFVPDGSYTMLLLLFAFVGVVLLILASQIFHWVGAVQPGGVVLCIILFSTPADTYIAYSLNRMLDTGVGVAVALLVNWLLPRERVVRCLQRLHLHK